MKFRAAALAIAIIGAIAVLSGVRTTHADSTFAPTSSLRFCKAMTSFIDPTFVGSAGCAETLTTGTHPDTTNTLTLDSGLNFDSLVTFTPTTLTIGTAIPVGSEIGAVHMSATLGVLNNACNTSETIDWVLYNVGLTSSSYPKAQGQSDRFGAWDTAGPWTSGPTGIDTGAFDADHADATSIPLQNVPQYILDAFPGSTISAVYGGLTRVHGDWWPLYLVEFPAGALATLPGPYALMTANMGKPQVRLLGDPTATIPSPDNATDVCTPLSIQTTLLGQPGGSNRITSPGAAGTVIYQQYIASLRDTDQDGYENAIDTCPLNPNAGNPRTPGGGDANGDGIDDSCDTNGGTPGTDVDTDGYLNRGDNCPQVANASQAEAELASGAPADRGPRSDLIGDDCDTGAITIAQNGHSVSITLSPTVANGRYMLADVDGIVSGPDIIALTNMGYNKRCGTIRPFAVLGIPDWSQQ